MPKSPRKTGPWFPLRGIEPNANGCLFSPKMASVLAVHYNQTHGHLSNAVLTQPKTGEDIGETYDGLNSPPPPPKSRNPARPPASRQAAHSAFWPASEAHSVQISEALVSTRRERQKLGWAKTTGVRIQPLEGSTLFRSPKTLAPVT